MTLKSLDEFNSDRWSAYSDYGKPRPNGIACPKCGSELIDSNPSITLTSNPPQTAVACNTCGYASTRVC